MRRKLARMVSTALRSSPEDVKEPVVSNLLGGINIVDDPESIADNEFVAALNWDIRENKLVRRLGFEYLTPAKPDSLRVLGFFGIRRFNESVSTLRFTKSSIYKLFTGLWVPLTGPVLGGGDYDDWECFVVEDRIFASNGVDVLYELNTSLNTYAAAGNAREYEFYCVANRRICAANLRGASPNPIEFAASGNRNYTQWDPATDISAYRNSLVDAEEDTSDEITGLFGIKDSVVVLRARSIWIGTPQPIASAPFAFRKVVSGIGCTSPRSAAKVENDSVIFFDPASKQVYKFQLRDDGSVELQPIGDKVYNRIYDELITNELVSAAYDQKNNEYHLLIENQSTSTVTIWKYILDYKAWLQDRVGNGVIATAFPYIESFSGTIGSLGSTPIGSLSGTIDSLSSNISHDTRRYVLLGNGDIGFQSEANYDDFGTYEEVELTSKTYTLNTTRMHFLGLLFSFATGTNFKVRLGFYKDSSAQVFHTWEKLVQWKIRKPSPLVPFRKHVHCDKFYWKLTGGNTTPVLSEGLQIKNYAIKFTPAGEF